MYHELSLADVPQLHPVGVFGMFWNSKREGVALPRRLEFDPTKMVELLPWILLLDVIEIEGVVQFRYRLTGTGCRDLLGVDYTGKILGEALTIEGARERREESLRAVESGEPVYARATLPVSGKDFLVVYRGVFPVTIQGEKAEQLFVIYGHEALRLEAPGGVVLKRA